MQSLQIRMQPNIFKWDVGYSYLNLHAIALFQTGNSELQQQNMLPSKGSMCLIGCILIASALLIG